MLKTIIGARLVFALAGIAAGSGEARGADVIHVFVALADNASQGIAPVPARIGDGDKPDANLYWGCTEGVKSWFARSKRWKKVASPAPPRAEILERLVFKHVSSDAWLVADAWRGREIRHCLQEFARAAAGDAVEQLKVKDVTLSAGGASALVAYIGHDGLMDFTMTWPARVGSGKIRPAIVLCCMSQHYFAENLKRAGARPLLTTTQLMYPGAFVLHDALEVWLDGKGPKEIREAAGRAYAKNQGISQKAALGVFAGE